MLQLRVSRSHGFFKPAAAYKLTSPEDPDHCLGAIYLDEAWRTSRPDDLDFLIIGFVIHDNGPRVQPQYSYGVKFMCVEWVDDISYRVQLAHDPEIDTRGFWTPPGKGRQSFEHINRIQPEPKGRTLIKLG